MRARVFVKWCSAGVTVIVTEKGVANLSSIPLDAFWKVMKSFNLLSVMALIKIQTFDLYLFLDRHFSRKKKLWIQSLLPPMDNESAWQNKTHNSLCITDLEESQCDEYVNMYIYIYIE